MAMLRDAGTQMTLRLKLLCRDRATVIIFLVSVVCFFLGMGDMNKEAEELAALPVGIVNLSDSVQAKELAERIGKLQALHVTVGEYPELEKAMKQGYLRCIFEIRKDYADRIAKGKYHELLTVYHVEGDSTASVISDIVAGEMMYDICLAQAYRQYEALEPGEKDKYTRESYMEYTASLLGGEDFDFAFRFSFVDSKKEQERRGTENGLFYRQGIAAAAAMLISMLILAAMSGVVKEKEQGISRRRRMLSMGKLSEAAGNIGAVLAIALVMAVVFSGCTCVAAGKADKFLAMLWTTMLFSAMIALLYYLLAKCSGGLIFYQLTAAVLLLFFGVSGFLSMVEGVLLKEFPVWFHYLPNCSFLRKVAELLAG